MNGIIIFVGVCMAILLYFWALTQQHCNDNSVKIDKGLEAVKDALQAMERYCDTLQTRIQILEKCVKPTYGYDNDLTLKTGGEKRTGIVRIESGNLNETLDKETTNGK